jgi:8-oxo-dGTP pyrophosphatase MutT (NUDIX family)
VPASVPRVGDAPESLEGLLGRFEVLVPPVSTARAAVTIVLRRGEREVETLLIVRAANPDDPAAGDVAFPGGHVSDADGSLVSTALRELEEEVGLTAADLDGAPRYVGTELGPRRAFRVGVFAAAIAPVAQPPTVRSAREVAHVFWLPRSALAATRTVTRETSQGPIPVNATLVEGHVLWGFTRRVLREFFALPTEDDLLGPAFARDPSTSAGIGPGPRTGSASEPLER